MMDKYDKIIEQIQGQQKTLETLKGAAGSGKAKDIKAFDKEVSRLWTLHFPSLPFFKNKAAALIYLNESGYKIGRDKFYVAAKKGELKVQEDGRVFNADLDSYILRAELDKESDAKIENYDEISIDNKKVEFKTNETKLEKLEVELGILKKDWAPKEERDSKDIEKILELRSACLAWEDRWPPLLEDLNAAEMKTEIHKEVFSMLKNFSIDGKFSVLDKLINCRACIDLEENLIKGLKDIKSDEIPAVINKMVSRMFLSCSFNGEFGFMGERLALAENAEGMGKQIKSKKRE